MRNSGKQSFQKHYTPFGLCSVPPPTPLPTNAFFHLQGAFNVWSIITFMVDKSWCGADKKTNRNKDEPFCEEAELLHVNPSYANLRFPNDRKTTVSTNDLAPQGTSPNKETESTTLTPTTIAHSELKHEQSEHAPLINKHFDATETVPSSETVVTEPVALRRSTRL